MNKYKNLSGQSGVLEYEIGVDFIVVKFDSPGKSGATTYRYSYKSAGQENIEKMKQLAVEGMGLNSYINTEVRKAYENKW